MKKIIFFLTLSLAYAYYLPALSMPGPTNAQIEQAKRAIQNTLIQFARYHILNLEQQIAYLNQIIQYPANIQDRIAAQELLDELPPELKE